MPQPSSSQPVTSDTTTGHSLQHTVWLPVQSHGSVSVWQRELSAWLSQSAGPEALEQAIAFLEQASLPSPDARVKPGHQPPKRAPPAPLTLTPPSSTTLPLPASDLLALTDTLAVLCSQGSKVTHDTLPLLSTACSQLLGHQAPQAPQAGVKGQQQASNSQQSKLAAASIESRLLAALFRCLPMLSTLQVRRLLPSVAVAGIRPNQEWLERAMSVLVQKSLQEAKSMQMGGHQPRSQPKHQQGSGRGMRLRPAAAPMPPHPTPTPSDLPQITQLALALASFATPLCQAQAEWLVAVSQQCLQQPGGVGPQAGLEHHRPTGAGGSVSRGVGAGAEAAPPKAGQMRGQGEAKEVGCALGAFPGALHQLVLLARALVVGLGVQVGESWEEAWCAAVSMALPGSGSEEVARLLQLLVDMPGTRALHDTNKGHEACRAMWSDLWRRCAPSALPQALHVDVVRAVGRLGRNKGVVPPQDWTRSLIEAVVGSYLWQEAGFHSPVTHSLPQPTAAASNKEDQGWGRGADVALRHTVSTQLQPEGTGLGAESSAQGARTQFVHQLQLPYSADTSQDPPPHPDTTPRNPVAIAAQAPLPTSPALPTHPHPSTLALVELLVACKRLNHSMPAVHAASVATLLGSALPDLATPQLTQVAPALGDLMSHLQEPAARQLRHQLMARLMAELAPAQPQARAQAMATATTPEVTPRPRPTPLPQPPSPLTPLSPQHVQQQQSQESQQWGAGGREAQALPFHPAHPPQPHPYSPSQLQPPPSVRHLHNSDPSPSPDRGTVGGGARLHHSHHPHQPHQHSTAARSLHPHPSITPHSLARFIQGLSGVSGPGLSLLQAEEAEAVRARVEVAASPSTLGAAGCQDLVIILRGMADMNCR